MDIILNGLPHQLNGKADLASLIEAMSLSNHAIAVAVNRQIVIRAQWQYHVLQAQDSVDVVRAIGGG